MLKESSWVGMVRELGPVIRSSDLLQSNFFWNLVISIHCGASTLCDFRLLQIKVKRKTRGKTLS